MPFLRVDPGVMAEDGDLHHIIKASSKYGGLTVIDAYAVTGGTISAGSGYLLVLQNYGASGTIAGGTVGSVGGTADPITTVDTPQQFSLTAAQVFLDAGEWLVLKKVEQGNVDINAENCVIVEYVDGVVTQG